MGISPHVYYQENGTALFPLRLLDLYGTSIAPTFHCYPAFSTHLRSVVLGVPRTNSIASSDDDSDSLCTSISKRAFRIGSNNQLPNNKPRV